MGGCLLEDGGRALIAGVMSRGFWDKTLDMGESTTGWLTFAAGESSRTGGIVLITEMIASSTQRTCCPL